jgi:hypothetical protein
MGTLLGGGSLLLGAIQAQQKLKQKMAVKLPFLLNPRLPGKPGLDVRLQMFPHLFKHSESFPFSSELPE